MLSENNTTDLKGMYTVCVSLPFIWPIVRLIYSSSTVDETNFFTVLKSLTLSCCWFNLCLSLCSFNSFNFLFTLCFFFLYAHLRLLQLCQRTMALPVGRGLFTLFSYHPVPTEPLPVPKLNLTGNVVMKALIVLTLVP